MKIITIEPTPSPNSMKIVVDTELPFGKSYNFTKDNKDEATGEAAAILAIEGIKGVYHVADFFAVERNAKYAWEGILASIRQVLGEDVETQDETIVANEFYGEVYVHVQFYKQVPLQVKVFDNQREHRVSCGDRFVDAFNQIIESAVDENYIFQRKWIDYGVRYGELEEIAEAVKQEIDVTYSVERLAEIVAALNNDDEKAIVQSNKLKITVEQFQQPEWEKRFQLLDQMADPELDDLPLLDVALQDEQMSIRRLATVYLGMVEDVTVVPYLERALQDKSAAVRRTAGDCMSDLGFVEFESAMQQALQDKNKLVRWRAAMYLYEAGTEKSLPVLKAAADDKEFEVKLQVKMAIARIEQGEEAKGSVWKQMTESRQQ
ncbi:conserved virulence factor C family protein [Lysinibacillus fusiformis]|uniref:conserved virulence factor C family protein n=1 Tax=Lysinibacillus fusiformis TaxID=28031 RepID=UPI000889ED84|nr:virulence factor [Lysinibacillus fusiformis]SCX45729.1 HEAT repeat-containing protein [Lysinibacillus fusiformis]SDB16715.1 HEAT repeat-containing protein [Lysinibacillus fusiformis]SFI00743.1 HEAT repeat-containing protein [Lysinibacillus fusiformis]SFS47213.1 HEAT repeat-containing protein [Lysinibacillus fusiformis]